MLKIRACISVSSLGSQVPCLGAFEWEGADLSLSGSFSPCTVLALSEFYSKATDVGRSLTPEPLLTLQVSDKVFKWSFSL